MEPRLPRAAASSLAARGMCASAAQSCSLRGTVQDQRVVLAIALVFACLTATTSAAATVAVAATGEPGIIAPWALDPAVLHVALISLASRDNIPSDLGTSLRRQFPRSFTFDAVDGRMVDASDPAVVSLFAQYNIAMRSRRTHWELDSRGAIGAYMSHIRLLTEFIAAPASTGDVMLVLEDDSDVPDDFAQTLSSVAAEMPPSSQWDLWLVGPGEVANSSKSSLALWSYLPPHARLVDVKQFWGLHSYIVSRRGAARIVASAYPIVVQVDGHMSLLALLGKLTVVWREDKPRGLHIRERLGTRTTVQTDGTCFICELPTRYNRKHDVMTWIAYGAVLGFVVHWLLLRITTARMLLLRCYARLASRGRVHGSHV